MHNRLLIALALTAVWCVPAAGEIDDKAFKNAKKRATASLKSGDATSTAAAISVLASDDSARAVTFFLSLAKVPDHSVYTALRDGLASMSSDDAKDAMLKSVEKKGSPLVKLLIVDAMEKRSDEFPEKVLSAALAAKQGEIQRAAIMVIAKKKIRPTCGAMIDLLGRLEKKEGDGLNANLIRKTLHDLTHESFETAEDWGKYWASNTEGNAEAGGEKGTKRRKRPTFYGSEILSNRVVFVIDTSLSMDEGAMKRQGARVYAEGQGPKMEPAGPDTRIERAKAQLSRVVSELPKGSKFGIVAYSAPKPGQTKLPKGKFPPEINKFHWLRVWKQKLAPVNKKSVGSALKFVQRLYADGLTYTLRGIEAAFEVPEVDTIVLLSDGAPNDIDANSHQPLKVPEILAEVSKLNRKRRLVINTFGILPPGQSTGNLAKFLKDLAEQNGGTFTEVKKDSK